MSDLINSASLRLREIIMDALGKLVAEEAVPSVPLPSFNIEIPADKSHGDFAANTAMVCAKALRMPPRKIAEMICEKLDLEGTIFEKAEVAGPGFLNFFLGRSWFSDVVKNVLAEGENYGKTETGAGKRVLVEFVSANPTGPMHIGNARGGAIGDCLASVLQWAGYHAEREFYVNDAGNQIEKFGKSLELRYLQLCSDKGQQLIHEYGNDTEKLCTEIYAKSGEGEDFEMPEDVYLGTDIIEHAANYYHDHSFELKDLSGEERRKALVDYALPINIAGLERDLKKYRIVYDNWFRESTVHEKNETKKVVDKLLEAGKAYEQDGAVWFKATEYGLDKDFVLKRSNGLYTYIVPDIAYHYDKLVTRNFDKAINVLGADHHGYVPRLKAALTALGVDASKLDVVLMQMVRLVRNGETVKLSKRSGKAITLVTLLDEIPIDAARFYFNLREANSQFEFDLDLAVEKSSQNPVFYVQYAHARICSMLRALAEEGINVPETADLDLLSDPRERELIRHLASLPKEIDLAARSYDPAKITKYTIDLATLFHRFYDACSVKNAETKELMNARILLCVAVRQTLRNTLEILNIDRPEKM
ncbi:arginine--tRNA ligase [Ruminococcus flavefaciens]|uniref:arginine--tRNA ligase n=1 Tax=Ruminococcus flavefaciens TaxID=1265 RepID=UPI0026ED1086|nr:arginine--tRNA ligase [Ruminococcus flavefaciens]MDD7515336.1 arginine--tRNA ligase [Ruminococcus flavefaciens]MDY5691012.1 arginine--tRNA ligase [Ruminococcus flavefaciens]